jgi:glycosyltransferase involved in cell wall biosynthesis
VRIVFDGICLGDGPVTGVARSFLHGLVAYAAQFPGDLVLLLPDGARPPDLDGVRCAAAPRGALRRQLLLPRLLRALGADLLHSPVAAVPLRAPCPTIATVHDLPWLDPTSGERTPLRRRLATRASLRAASAVLAPSQHTLAAARTLVADAARLHHVPHGLPPLAGTAAGPRDGPFLVLGDDRPRKNRARVAAAHVLAARADAELPPLRFVGPPRDYVDEAEKARLLRTCRAVVQCSLFEGFGMPVLEALQAGAPVVCSDIAPFRELAGDDAVFADPRRIPSIAAALSAVLTTGTRARLAAAGPRRAAAFPASETARRWHELHTRLVAR